jgi:hypothetical protein
MNKRQQSKQEKFIDFSCNSNYFHFKKDNKLKKEGIDYLSMLLQENQDIDILNLHCRK